jgi:glutamine amidotransferase
MIRIVDYGIGNLLSVLNAFQAAGIDAELSSDPKAVQAADKVLLPGVGAFGVAMDRLERGGFADALREFALVRQRPLMGICLGMQLLAETGTEFGERPGLGFIRGRIEKIDTGTTNLRLPHMGWNDLVLTRETRLLAGLQKERSAYFAHSYVMVPVDTTDIAATTDYGMPLVAAVERSNIQGAQFHPEKSQLVGVQLLKNFAAL